MGRIKLALGILLLVGGLAITGHGYVNSQEEPAEAPIEEVDGVVLNSTTKELPTEGENERFSANVTYQFSYGGQTYESQRVYRNKDTVYNTTNDAFRTASRYASGDNVTVNVPNGDPTQAYLVTETDVPYEEAQMVLGVVLFLIGVSLTRHNR